jgi:uncharacterized protein involved in exopolysaccharide biosynthesis
MALQYSPSLFPREEDRSRESGSFFWAFSAKLPEVFRAHRWLIVGCAVLAAVLVGGIAILQPKTYTATASFVPQTKPTLSGLAGLATQLGVNAASGEVGQSSQFYIELIRSRTVLWAVGNANYSLPAGAGAQTGNLMNFYGLANLPPIQQRDALFRRLGDDISGSVSRLTGTVVLRVTSTDPSIAQQIAQNVLLEVNKFNARTRQSQAAQERTFAEDRLAQMRGELQAAESRLQFFLQENRDFKTSARLNFDEDRLAREVAEKQQVVTSLAESYEQARIEEVRDRSVITVVDLPERPFKANPRNVVKKSLVGLLVGSLIGLLAALVTVYGLPWRLRPNSQIGGVTA